MAALFRWTDVVHSQSGLGAGGALLVASTVAAGLGLCALLGLQSGPATSQVLPYLAMGLGMDAVFLMVRTYAERIVDSTADLEVSFPMNGTASVVKVDFSFWLGREKRMVSLFSAFHMLVRVRGGAIRRH